MSVDIIFWLRLVVCGVPCLPTLWPLFYIYLPAISVATITKVIVSECLVLCWENHLQ